MINFFEKKEYATLVCYFLIIICAAFALSYPLAFRTAANEQLFVGDKSYETLLAVQDKQLLLEPWKTSSWIVAPQPQPSPFSFATYLYALLLTLIPPWALPALLSLLLLTLLWLTLNTFTIPLSARFIATCMFAFSPLFVITQLSLGSATFLLIFISLLVFALRSHWHPLLCILIAFICGLFGVDAVLMLALVLIFTTQKTGHAPIDRQKKFAIVGAIAGLAIWLALSILTKASFSSLLAPRVLSSLFIDFGAQSGQTILLVILALIGAVNIWQKELRWHFVAALAIVLWSSFFPNTSLIATAVLSYFAGSAFTKIWNSKWTYLSLKVVVLASILLAILVSYFIFSNQLITASPDVAASNAFSFIEKNTQYTAVIFTAPAQSAMVAYFSQRQVVSTSNPAHTLFDERRLQTQQILYAKSLASALKELQSLNVTHILIDPQLQSGDQWRADKGGLALLLRNRHAFTLVYDAEYLLYQVNYEN